jgi:hypothetical protein
MDIDLDLVLFQFLIERVSFNVCGFWDFGSVYKANLEE